MGRGLILCVAGCLLAFSACQKQTDEFVSLQETQSEAKKPVNIIYFDGKMHGNAGALAIASTSCTGIQCDLTGNGKASQFGNFTFTASHCENAGIASNNNTISVFCSDGIISLQAKNGIVNGFYTGNMRIDNSSGQAVVDLEMYFDGGTGKYENAKGYAFVTIDMQDLVNKNFSDAKFNGGISY